MFSHLFLPQSGRRTISLSRLSTTLYSFAFSMSALAAEPLDYWAAENYSPDILRL